MTNIQSNGSHPLLNRQYNCNTNVNFWIGFQNQHWIFCYTLDKAFQVHLMSVIQNVCGDQLNMFKQVIEVLFMHYVERNFDFNNSFFNPMKK